MHVHIVLCCGVKTVLFTIKLSESSCHVINPYLFTKFHTSKHLGKRVTQTCMFTLFGAKRVLFTNKLSECWCRISIPYLCTKFHASKHMVYCNHICCIIYEYYNIMLQFQYEARGTCSQTSPLWGLAVLLYRAILYVQVYIQLFIATCCARI